MSTQLVCMPVAWGPTGIAGATPQACSACGTMVWVSPLSMRYVGPGIAVICLPCMNKQAGPGPLDVGCLPGQEDELKQNGMTSEDIDKAKEILMSAFGRREIGERVGAIAGAVEGMKIVQVFGYGVYEGYADMPPEVTFLGEPAPRGRPSPMIRLDSGETVFGCECWWGPEEKVKAELANAVEDGFTIETITVKAYREMGMREREKA